MNQETINILLLLTPLLIGGIIAAVNATSVNDTTEKAEAWSRRTKTNISTKDGWFYNYILNPIFWTVVKFSDWTDSFAHRGLKNGVRVATTLYLIAAWCSILYAAFMLAVMIVIAVVVLYIVFNILAGSSDSSTNKNKNEQPEKEITRRNMRRGTSERKEKIFGGEYTQYYDENGNEVGTAEIKEKIFGGTFVQYYDKNGNEIGTSEMKEKIFGGDYAQHYDDDGNEIGTSEGKEKILGGKYTQHYDDEGNEKGTSEKKEKFFGGEYTENKP